MKKNNQFCLMATIIISSFCCSCSYYKSVFVNKDQDYTKARTSEPLKIADLKLLIEKNDRFSIPNVKNNVTSPVVDLLPPDYTNTDEDKKLEKI